MSAAPKHQLEHLLGRMAAGSPDECPENKFVRHTVVAADEYLGELLSAADPVVALRKAGFMAAADALEKRTPPRPSRKRWAKAGRPIVMDAGKIAATKARLERGESPTQIAQALGVSRASVYRHLATIREGDKEADL